MNTLLSMVAKTDDLARENAAILRHARDVMAAAYLLEQKCVELDRRVNEALSVGTEISVGIGSKKHDQVRRIAHCRARIPLSTKFAPNLLG